APPPAAAASGPADAATVADAIDAVLDDIKTCLDINGSQLLPKIRKVAKTIGVDAPTRLDDVDLRLAMAARLELCGDDETDPDDDGPGRGSAPDGPSDAEEPAEGALSLVGA